MKLIALFLACIAATQASTFSCPSYDFWCSHNFHVLPPQSYYCYTLPINRNWFTSRYYADFLVEFPQKLEDGTCEDEKTDIDSQIGAYQTKLANSRSEIEEKLNAELTPFITQIDELHLTYVNTFKKYLKNIDDETSDEYKNKVAAYEAELLVIKNQAITNFTAEVTNVMARIESFHVNIIARFRSCLETRTTRIASYKSKIDERANDFVTRYRTSLENIVTKRVDFVKCVFDRLYADKTKDEDYETAITNYNNQLTAEIEQLIGEFQSKIDTSVAKLKENYRCNYKCYFQTGCYGFSRKTFTQSW